MKKSFLKFTTITLSLLILCVSFNSCQKDQAYNPEQKIKKIYIMGDIFFPKILWQEWTWDENKLMRIDYYPGDNFSATEYYTYEENKLIKVEDNEGYFQISYTGSGYNKIEYFKKDDNLLIASWDFSYRNNKVSKIILTYDYSFWIPDKIERGGFLSSLISKDFISTIESSAKKQTKGSSYPKVITLTYKYNGDNIKEKKWETDDSSGYIDMTICYKSYDKMLNPFHKHVGLMNIESFSAPLNELVTSKNNPLEVQELISEGYMKEIIYKYSYKYDKSFPIEVLTTRIYVYRENYFNIPNYIDTTAYYTYYEYE